MTITITGIDHNMIIDRFSTGIFSLDWLLRYKDTWGFPLYTITEIYSNPSVGKSTLSTYLSGRVPPQTGTIKLCDLENAVEEDHLRNTLGRSGFGGSLDVISSTAKGKPREHAEMLDEAINSILDPPVSAVIIDSLGAYQSTPERDNPIGDANMGRRAMNIAQASRKAMSNLRLANHPAVVFYINHIHSVMGGKGHDTPGGVTKNFAASQRLMLYTVEKFDDGSSLVSITGEKIRYGGYRKGEKAYVYISPGNGVIPEMCNVFDCVVFGIATRSHTVKIGDKSYGYLSALMEKAIDGSDPELFQEFKEKLDDLRPKTNN